MEQLINRLDSLKKSVSQSSPNKDRLRREFVSLLLEAISIIAELDIRNEHGYVIETGYSIIETILNMEKARKDISDQIDIIGRSKWLRLKTIWKRMREIESEDKA